MATQYYRGPRNRRKNPEDRAEERTKEIERIRRKYRKGLKIDKKLVPGERKQIEDMVIVLKLAGYERTQIARIIGISLGQVREMIAAPGFTERLVKIRSTLTQSALDLLQGYTIEAIQTIVDIMRMADDDKVVLAACSEILDRAGIVKASRQERLQVNESRLTVTDDGILEKLRDASPEVQEQAAQVIEQLESLLEQGSKPMKKAKQLGE